MDRFESMTVLLAVVEGGSLSAAGRALGMPLATVSRHLSDLEARVRAQLVVRSSRRIALTDAGRDYVAACRRIVDDVVEAEREVAGEYRAPQGELIVAAPIVFGRLHVLPILVDFLTAHPAVDVRLVLDDRIVSLAEEPIDVAVRIGELPDSRLVATRVGAIGRVVCASPDYLERHGVPSSLDALAGHACVTFDALSTGRAWIFGPRAVPVRSRLAVNTAEAAVDAAIAGVGPTHVLSYQAQAAIDAGTLRVVLADVEAPSVPVSLVYAKPGRMPLKLRAFVDFAVPRLRERLKAAT